jgi:hypothetical protein
MVSTGVTRREFILSGAALVGSLTLGVRSALPVGRRHLKVYRRSAGGRRVSNAAKKHNANKRYSSKDVALSDLPHPGDTSFVVELDVSLRDFIRLFVRRVDGKFRIIDVVDLRHV